MKDNWNIFLIGEKSLLVPYRKRHVVKYHEWMECAELRESTASERLTLDEEYKMQVTEGWRDDPKKCTFIILDALKLASNSDMKMKDFKNIGDADVSLMIGDVNLFLEKDENFPNTAEIEVMIAESSHRGRGFARDAVTQMIMYGATHLGVQRFIAKIEESNAASIKLFESLGFCQSNYVLAFHEKEYEMLVENGLPKWNLSCELIMIDVWPPEDI